MASGKSLTVTSKNRAHHFAPDILREYDIRGLVDKNLNEADAYALGRSFAAYVAIQIPDRKQHTICVGYDGRLSSPVLEAALMDGLVASGVRVVNVGLGPTPMLYFAVKHMNADAGIMVTGSHNPPEYNGFKMTMNAYPVFGQAVQEIGRIAARGEFIDGAGSVETIDIREDYIARLMQDYVPGRELTIAWDAGNGAAGDIMKRLTAKLPGRHILLHADIDGSFPNHHPDPTVDENLLDLQEAVLKNKCDLGIAFDGDGDRIGVVDENGAIIRCDTLLVIYAREVLAQQPGATIIGDVKCSGVLFDEIRRMGGNPVMWKTGHSVMKDKMREMGAPLAGELSGHIFFADRYYGFDDALYCAVRLLNAMPQDGGGLSSLTRHLPQTFNTPEIRIDVREDDKFTLVEAFAENIAAHGFSIDTTDGLRVTMKQGWFLLRASNTQPALTARMEAQSEIGLAEIMAFVRREIEKLGYKMG